ncbi:MAG: N-acetylmuramoyl-L-alanine amidase [Rickettsiales bacterium]|nr:N-acetylmuramoyl-L-alanine amidase [Rickettsiales bacterium]
MQMISTPSPNHDGRNGQPVDMLVMHYTDMRSCEDAVARLCDPEARVSAHYVITKTGVVYQLVAESERAWHAGESFWRGQTNVNARSIGIEISNPGHSEGYSQFPPVQMVAVVALSQGILARHKIPAQNVVGHSDVAFLRKQDPGELFDWPMLAKAGVGVFPAHARPLTGPVLRPGDKGKEVMRLQQSLCNWGYGLKIDGEYGEKTKLCVIAFQRHFRPANLDGVWDNECAGILAALHGMV